MNLLDIPAIDHHAHNLLKLDVVDSYPYAAAFTEGYDTDIVNYHARHTLFYRRSIRDIAQLLNCEPTEEAILKCRQQLRLENLTRICFESANLSEVFLDDGFLSSKILPWQWHQQFTQVKRLLRLEYLAEKLIEKEDNFDNFLEHFRSAIDSTPPEVVGLKSIVAYRTGLNIQVTTLEEAKSNFEAIKRENQLKYIRLENKPLIDFLFIQALEIAAKRKLPLQLHTGFGDPDLDLRLANPLYLRPLLENKKFHDAPIVLLHASYPYSQEAGYLASVYPQVYLDFGLAVPFLSVSGMKLALQQLLELAPTTKLMYSSDAHYIPELYYLGAKWGREILAKVLDEAVSNSDLNATEALAVAEAVLFNNARKLYQKWN